MLGDNRFRENAVVRNTTPERLDELAQLTAPREWIVLVCLGLVLAAIVAWGVLGSVERTVRLDGALILASEGRAARPDDQGRTTAVTPAEAGSIEAIAFVAPGDAQRLETGMTARVTFGSVDAGRPLPAELDDIAPRVPNPPDWLARILPMPATTAPGHAVRFTLTNPQASASLPGNLAPEALGAGTLCRIEIVLERVSPFALLTGR